MWVVGELGVYEFLIRAGIFEYVIYYVTLICVLRIDCDFTNF